MELVKVSGINALRHESGTYLFPTFPAWNRKGRIAPALSCDSDTGTCLHPELPAQRTEANQGAADENKRGAAVRDQFHDVGLRAVPHFVEAHEIRKCAATIKSAA